MVKEVATQVIGSGGDRLEVVVGSVVLQRVSVKKWSRQREAELTAAPENCDMALLHFA